MSGARSGFLTFLRDISGNVLPMAAIGMLLSAALVGGGIDMSRAYRAQNRLQAACDSGTLAGRRAVVSSGFDAAAQTQASNFFNTNFDNTSLETSNTVFTPTSDDNGQTVKATATTTLKLAVMKIFGFQSFSLAVTCQASMGVGNSDVVMVLDTTGSMGTDTGGGVTRMDALQQAMKNFYSTVKTATTSTNARIRYGFVPFSTTVNVGKLLTDRDPTFLNDTWTIQSRMAVQDGAPDTDTNSLNSGTKSDYTTTTYATQADCLAALPANTPWTNNGTAANLGTTSTQNNGSGDQRWTTTVSQPQQRTAYDCKQNNGNNATWKRRTFTQTQDYDTNTDWKWEYKPVAYDVTAYKTFAAVTTNTGSYGGSVSSTWKGCIEERGSSNTATFTFVAGTGITPAAAKDLDLDSAPTNDTTTKWSPMWPQVAYSRYSNTSPTNTGYQASSYCPYKAQLLAEMTQTDFGAYADALNPTGSTYLDIGIAWGGRLSSPQGIFSDNVNIAPPNGGEVSRHLIFMTDGIMEPDEDIQASWGIEQHDRRVTSDGSNSQDTSRHTARFLALCEAIKAKGIRLWAISFTSGTSTSLSTCASTNSYYNADNPTQLNAAFQEIAKQVGELRLTQ
jgi:Flp pilus assembly protein TadG